MRTIRNKKGPSVLRRVLPHLLPDTGNAIRFVLFLACVAAISWIGWDEDRSFERCQLLASDTFGVLTLIGPTVCALLVVRALIIARRANRKGPSFFFQCALLIMVGMTWMMAVLYFNRVLDHSSPRPVSLVVSETFAIEFADDGYRINAGERQFVAFQTPRGLGDWMVVLLPSSRLDLSPTLDAFVVGQRFQVLAYPGRFGCPWFEFREASPVRQLLRANAGRGTRLSELHPGKCTVWEEHQRGKIVAAHGHFRPGSANWRQLEEWGVPITIEGRCDE